MLEHNFSYIIRTKVFIERRTVKPIEVATEEDGEVTVIRGGRKTPYISVSGLTEFSFKSSKLIRSNDFIEVLINSSNSSKLFLI